MKMDGKWTSDIMIEFSLLLAGISLGIYIGLHFRDENNEFRIRQLIEQSRERQDILDDLLKQYQTHVRIYREGLEDLEEARKYYYQTEHKK